MAQEDAGRQSTRLLIIACLLAVVFIVLYNVQRWYENHQREASQVGLVLVTQELAPGALLRSDNVREILIPGDVAGDLKGFHTWGKDQRFVLNTTTVTRAVATNSLLRLADTSPVAAEEDDPSIYCKKGWRILPLQVDSESVPAAYMRRGSRVDMYAVLSGTGKPAQMELVIEYLEVMGVDRQVEVDPQRGSFRNIIVQVPEDLVAKLLEVKRRAQKITLVIRRLNERNVSLKYPYDRTDPNQGGTIAEPVRDEISRPIGAAVPVGASGT